ncbi:hypothetical protein PG985_005619 [Apiospora marii]
MSKLPRSAMLLSVADVSFAQAVKYIGVRRSPIKDFVGLKDP